MPDHDEGQAQSSHPSSSTAGVHEREHQSSGSPQRPSYSPVTPTLSHSSLPHDDDHMELPPPQFMDEPDPVPVDLDANTDAMALRATLSVLQLQRQQAVRDMRELDKMKQAAIEDPEQFIKDLRDGKLTRPPREGLEIDGMGAEEDEATSAGASKFGKLPTAQNVMRCPPVEWAKYHIVGEALDRMHKVQQHYPGYIEEMQGSSDRPQPHTIAAPYRPFMDRQYNKRPKSKP